MNSLVLLLVVGVAASAANATMTCPDKQFTCLTGQTCCKMPRDEGYGCCPMPKATCCKDGLHCCPENNECNLVHNTCHPKTKSLSWDAYGSSTPMQKKYPAARTPPHRFSVHRELEDELIDNTITKGGY